MTPKFDESPYEAHWFRDETIVFDTIYTPEQTLFIKEARERGCRNVTGVEMFVRQAAAQFRLFTGQPASLDSMRETLRRAISAARFDD
jgi:3-dehydroquinate dehydratase/shikimate dehydrogenase